MVKRIFSKPLKVKSKVAPKCMEVVMRQKIWAMLDQIRMKRIRACQILQHVKFFRVFFEFFK